MSNYTHKKSTALGLFLTVLSVCFVTSTYAQHIQWHSIEQAEQAAKKQHRKVVIQVYTNWSGKFKELQNNVLSQQHIVKYLNDNFIVTKFDAETPNDVTFKNKTYRFVNQHGVKFNELASELLKGQLEFPTLVFFDEDMNYIQSIQYRNAEYFEMAIKYFGTDSHKSMPWGRWEKSFNLKTQR
jgi:thioredoxin-related protein